MERMGYGHGETRGTWSYVVGGRARLLGGVSPLPWWGARVLLVHHGAQNMLNGR